MPEIDPIPPSSSPPARVTVKDSGLMSVQAEHSLLFDATHSLTWLRQCRAATKVSIEANLPIIAGASALFEAVLRRCMHEVLYSRSGRGLPTPDSVRKRIEESVVYGEKVLAVMKEVFPTDTHPLTAAFLDGTAAQGILLLFRLRNIAAHGGSVWTRMELPTTVNQKSITSSFLRDKYGPLFEEIKKLGYDLKAADGVDGMTQLFSETAMIDEICRGAFTFLSAFLAVLKTDSASDAAAFHNAGIVWTDIARAFTGEAKWL